MGAVAVNIWDELEIQPTQDAGEIRAAYAKRLRQVHPEDDAAGFQRLRTAYELALRTLAPTRTPVPQPAALEPKSPAPAIMQLRVATTDAPPPAAVPTTLQISRAASDLLEHLLASPPDLRVRVLADSLSRDGWEGLDFRTQLEQAVARQLLSEYDRFDKIARLCIEYFGWADNIDWRGQATLLAELLRRHDARSWRLDIEASTSSRTRQAMALLRSEVDKPAFERFGWSNNNRGGMAALIKEMQGDYPAAQRYEINRRSLEWWIDYLRAHPPVSGQKKALSDTLGALFLVILALGGISNLASHHLGRSSTEQYQSEPAWGSGAAGDQVNSFLMQPVGASAWKNSVQYKRGDVVYFAGMRWVAREPKPGEAPGASSNWQNARSDTP